MNSGLAPGTASPDPAGRDGVLAPPADGAVPPSVASPESRADQGRRFLRQSVLLYGASYVAVFFHFLSGFLVAKFLGPALYGLRAVFGLVEQYEQFATLGTFQSMEREVPYHRGRGDRDEADRISRCALTANLLYAGVAAVLLVGSAAVVRSTDLDTIYADFLLFLAAFIILYRLERFYQLHLIIGKRTGSVSGLRIVEGMVTALASVTLVYFFALRGLFAGILIGKGAALAFAMARARWYPGWGGSWPLVRRLVVIGFPIMLVKFLFVFFQSVDKLLIASFLTTEMLGYFAVAAIISGVLFGTLADAVKVMFSPRMMEKLGETGDPPAVKHYFTQPTILIAWIAPIAVGSLFLVVHLPFRHLLTDYLPTITVAKLLLVGKYFFILVTMAILTCIALGRQVSLVWITVGGIVLNALLNVTFLRLGWGINGVAAGTAISYFLYATAVLHFALHLFGDAKLQEHLRMAALVAVPWLVFVPLVVALDRFIPVDALPFWPDVAVSTFRVIVFCAVFGLVLLPMREHPAFKRLRESLPRLRRAARVA